jgi:hypothetical protein
VVVGAGASVVVDELLVAIGPDGGWIKLLDDDDPWLVVWWWRRLDELAEGMGVTSSLTEDDADTIVLEEFQLSLVCELDHTDVVGSTQLDGLLGASACDPPQEVLVRWENISMNTNSENCETCIPVRTILSLTMLMYW